MLFPILQPILSTVRKKALPKFKKKKFQLYGVCADNLELIVAGTPEDLDMARELRYRIFFGEKGGMPSPAMASVQRDFDEFDDFCDHLLVIDRAAPAGQNPVVGTYRLLRGKKAKKLGKFYSDNEYDISNILATDGEVLELGRSCVAPEYRNRSTIQLLWHGIAAYVVHYDVKVLFGCASFPGLDIELLAEQLSYLHHNHLAPEHLRAYALPEQYVNMNLLPADQLNARKIAASLPPLIKGYLRVGAFVGEGAVLDHVCNTTDVNIVMSTDNMSEKYYNHYLKSSDQLS